MTRLASLLLGNQDTVPISTNGPNERQRNAPYPDVSVENKTGKQFSGLHGANSSADSK